MKKIIGIHLNNYRAFHNQYNRIDFSNGENVLIYGENGSGKSSLFKGLYDFINNSRIAKNFVPNRYAQLPNGSINVEFADFANNGIEIANSRQTLTFADVNSTNQVNFLQDASLAKGFLEYRSLLDVYLHKDPQPNLFDLIVRNLLGNYIPNNLGATYRLGVKWDQLQHQLTNNSYTRRNSNHQTALAELVFYERYLRSTLDDIFLDLNRMLNTYFGDLGITLNYNLKPFTFFYTYWKKDWYTQADLRLIVSKDTIPIPGDYSDFLNEARLSAFAICLYLASLKKNPIVDFQILYLDDIFVGLDAGNRIPILNIIESEFNDYQIFISTYDRHWYELAARYFKRNISSKWLNLEFYVGKAIDNRVTFDKPIITRGITNFEKAVKFLHHNTDPDYPAAGNYFRKYLEEIIPKYIPSIELTDANSTQLQDFKTTKIIELSIGFLKKTYNDASNLENVYSLLHGLIHPLSHYSIKGPVYKAELLMIEQSILSLESQLKVLDILNNYKCILEKGKRIKMTFCVNQQLNHYFFYEIELKSGLWVKNNPGRPPALCNVKCHADNYYGHNGGQQYPSGKANNSLQHYNYETLEIAYNQIYNFLNANMTPFALPATGYLSCCEWASLSGWVPLANLIVWP